MVNRRGIRRRRRRREEKRVERRVGRERRATSGFVHKGEIARRQNTSAGGVVRDGGGLWAAAVCSSIVNLFIKFRVRSDRIFSARFGYYENGEFFDH